MGIRLAVVDDNPHLLWNGRVHPANATFERFVAGLLDLPGRPVASITSCVPLREAATAPGTLPLDERIRVVGTHPFDGIAGYVRHAATIARRNRPLLRAAIAEADLAWLKVPASNGPLTTALAARAGVPRFVWVAGSAREVAGARYTGVRRIGALAIGSAYDLAGRLGSVGGDRVVVGRELVASLVEPDELRDPGERPYPRDPGVVRLFSRLPRLPFGIVPVPPEQAPAQPAAYYMPGSLELGRAGMFYANTYDLASRPRWNMESICLHEAVPGHHFQIALAQETEGLPMFRRQSLSCTAYIEGWGLYCESLGEALGLYEDPYQRFGALDAELLRACRLVLDTGMHALGWTRDQAIDYFVAHSPSPKHELVVEVDRYLVLPGQALAYKVGSLELQELRRQAQNMLMDAFDIRAFHDEVLRHGALPLDMLQRQITAWITAFWKRNLGA